MTDIVIAALYKFVPLEDIDSLQQTLKNLCSSLEIKGILLLASEGINGTVAGSRTAINQLKEFFQQDERFKDLEYKESFARTMPFRSLRVRLKKEIVTLGVQGINPTEQRGTYVEPEDWNKLIEDPEVTLIDVRNTYEVAIGTFKKALDPKTNSFREFPNFVTSTLDPKIHKKIAMACTGGIRCEKASAYMKRQGFEEVYHLKGGILKYLEQVPAVESLWEGECFVFDQRAALSNGLALSDYKMCFSCRYPLSVEDRQSPYYKEGLSCGYCHDQLTPTQKKRRQDRHHQAELAKKREREVAKE